MPQPRTNILAVDEAISRYVTIAGDLALFYHGPFSNWWYAPYEHDGVIYNCTEQHMMAAKAALHGDWAKREEIMACDGPFDGSQADFNQYPRRQQALGREVRNPATGKFDGVAWDALAVDLVTIANLAKFSQHPDLRAILAATVGLTLVEASPIDFIWGIGLKRDDPAAADPALWLGRNWLGLVLTRTRRLLCGV